jgi:hypothetical protein
MQVMLHELLTKAWGPSGFEAFVRRLQQQYARQAGVAAAAAAAQLTGLAEWHCPQAGMFMWFKLTGEVLSELVAACALPLHPRLLVSHTPNWPTRCHSCHQQVTLTARRSSRQQRQRA